MPGCVGCTSAHTRVNASTAVGTSAITTRPLAEGGFAKAPRDRWISISAW